MKKTKEKENRIEKKNKMKERLRTIVMYHCQG